MEQGPGQLGLREPKEGGPSFRGVLLAFLPVVLVAVGIGFLAARGVKATQETTTTTLPADPAVETAFLDAYERSFVGPYSLTGQLELANDQAIDLQSIVRTRNGDRYLDQTNSQALVGVNGTERSCSDTGVEFLCGDARPSKTPEEHRGEMAEMLELFRVSEGTPEMQPANRQADCFVIDADPGDGFSALGQRTVYCFDRDTGAILTRVTNRGKRTETFVVSSITAEVTPESLAPR